MGVEGDSGQLHHGMERIPIGHGERIGHISRALAWLAEFAFGDDLLRPRRQSITCFLSSIRQFYFDSLSPDPLAAKEPPPDAVLGI